jgi:FkbM family methyltransferase
MQSLLDRRLPLRTRLDLLAADLRRKLARRNLYPVRYGRGTVYLSNDDFVVDRKSFDFAVVEETYATDYEGAVVVDIGAHKGYFAAYAVTRGAHVVMAYEPESANLAVLERTAAAYPRVEWAIRRAAVDATSGRSALHVMGASWGHALAPPAAFAQYEVGTQEVEVVALADAVDEAAVLSAGRRVVVKVNIEGAECSAILGSPHVAWTGVDEVFVETHPWATCDASELATHLELAGFSREPSAHPAVLRMRRGASTRSGRRSGPR